jgi:MFS family permease
MSQLHSLIPYVNDIQTVFAPVFNPASDGRLSGFFSDAFIHNIDTYAAMPISSTKPRIFYGWYIAGISFTAYFFATGTGFYAFNALLEPLCMLRDWNRTDLNMALAVGTVFGFIGQYVYGTLLPRIGVKRLMLFGAVTGGIAFILIPRVEHLWQFYMVYALLFTGNGALGGIVAGTAVNNWFIRKRGKAMGIATAGMSLSGALLPVLALMLIHRIGLTGATFFIGMAMILFGPVAWVIVRDWPEDMGLGPDGDSAPFAANPLPLGWEIPPVTADAAEVKWGIRQLVRDEAFWKLGIAFSLMMIGTVGVMSQLKPRFSGIGFTDMTAMLMMGGTALTGAAGKYVWGSLCDRFNTLRVAAAMAAANIAGLALALSGRSMSAMILFIPVFGFSMGGIMSIYPIIVAGIYGRKNFAGVLRYTSVFLVLQLLGYIIAGMSFDRTGSYDAAYMVFIVFDLCAALLLITLRHREDLNSNASIPL